MTWTDERTAALRDLWQAGYTASQIASKLGDGLTRNAVLGKVHREGFQARKIVLTHRAPKPQRVPRQRKTRAEILYNRFLLGKPEPEPIVEISDDQIPIEQRKTLMELTNETCRWPVGDPSNPEFYFCGAMPFFDHPYCAKHCRMAYAPPASRPALKGGGFKDQVKRPARRFAA